MKHTPTLRTFLLASATCLFGHTQAQQAEPCATDLQQQRLIAQNPDLVRQNAEYQHGLQEYLKARKGLRDGADDVVYVIPIVFHVLYDPTAPNDAHNVSDAAIAAQMVKLNNDFRKRNADTTAIVDPFKPIAADVKVQFQLATKDPYGNCTNGIDRITSLRSTQAADFSKLNPWFREHYLNVWVIRALEQNTPGQITLAYSQLPPYVQDPMGALRDGVIMLASEVNPTSTTLSHEIGHYLNLEHVWGSNNQPGEACGDDGVADTPITKGHFSTCDVNDHTCNNWPMSGTYLFSQVTPTSGTTDPTPPPTGGYQDTLPGLTYSPFTAHGVSSNPAGTGQFIFTQWGTGAHAGDSLYSQLDGTFTPGKYYEVTVQPAFGRAMSLTGITFRAGRSATGPRTFAVRASIGGYGANLAASSADPEANVQAQNVFFFVQDTSTAAAVSVAVPDLAIGANGTYTHIRQAVTFRFYAWNAEDEDGDFFIDSVTLTGAFGAVDNAQNYMDYSYCTYMFTNGQRDRMRATLNSPVSQRNNLWTDANHAYTGTNGNEATCAPEADFYTMDPFVCPGTTVQFKANVKRATATGWAWTFDGGTPATSNLENPTVSFSTPGPHSVSLTASNSAGSNTMTKWNAVYIGANYSEAGNPLQEPFNNQDGFNRWAVQNYENNQSYWHWTNAAGHDAPGCAILNASQSYTLIQDMFQPNNFHDIDNLVTPSIAMPFLNGINLSFWYAYSTQTGVPEDITEKLTVYASSNCGNVWNQRLQLTGSQLITAGVRSAGYVPVANEWRQVSINLPSLYAVDRVRLKFEFTSGRYSNDLFIDDVNINGANVGIAEAAQGGGLGLYPNPASSNLTVVMDLAGASTGTLSFLDMTGRLIHSEQVRAGTERLELDLAKMGLSSGVYLVRLQHANGQRTERLVVR